ncbi:helix-turn-helix domain-containing protein [Rhodococcus fascians]|uniref:helix-turn-helix domain-containing protein n=2 Tax=Rhodococcoides fascians TaxID=1828 RepID=UPI0012D2FAFE|nr:helix-turn-helix domain-containing protein [Rhodococcus fascians]MBY4040057.1 helix-turn-helix domain-containing protein [Rhodococcus fascians]MBY4137966.1 helix-turn-helix domain-containing protein [Rhodococcus fascians]MBY4215885.1 helix-turn-helix domain-containing protein [Rhodococcus fascians]MBY4224469.1 helix-turn-helix domain-containing protein [Rhodococcus fascians]MBY4232006.1 helix-turn-helix domain-containing protein [Rhodococcus fascians]
MISSWTTRGLTPTDQMSYWADVLCQAFTPLAPWRSRDHLEHSSTRSGLPGWVRSAPIGGGNVAEISSCTQRIDHGKREVARSTDEVVFVNLQLNGHCVAAQDGRRCIVSRGEFTVVDSTRPYRLEFVEDARRRQMWRVLSFRLPRALLADVVCPEATTTARSFGGTVGSAHLLSSLMMETWGTDCSLLPSERQMIGAAHVDLLRAVLGGAAERSAGVTLRTDYTLRVAATRFIEDRLPVGRVLAAEVAEHVGISVRTLHALFARAGTTFGTVVRDHRLEACRRELADVRQSRTIGTIAASWGFSDSAHLAKAFRVRFGCSPVEYRQSVKDGASRQL